MNKLAKIQLFALTALVVLYGLTAASYAKVYAVTSPVAKKQPISGPNTPPVKNPVTSPIIPPITSVIK